MESSVPVRNRPTGVTGFIGAYVRSMRLYFAFITGVAGWIGVSFARYLYPGSTSTGRSVIILGILFLSYGINQVINDFFGLKEDRINSPHRPMVTGELNWRGALVLSALLIVVSSFVTWRLSPWALIPFAAGILLNLAYEVTKGVPFLGNIVFGMMISTCTAYGFLASLPPQGEIFTPPRLYVLGLVALMNALMCYYTYFKDYRGDKLTGKITAVVLLGFGKSKALAVILSFLPSAILGWLVFAGKFPLPINNTFIFLFVVTFFLQLWTGILYFKYPSGPKAYFSLVTNVRACTGGQALLIALFNPELALYLYIAAYVFIGFLFGLHGDRRA